MSYLPEGLDAGALIHCLIPLWSRTARSSINLLPPTAQIQVLSQHRLLVRLPSGFQAWPCPVGVSVLHHQALSRGRPHFRDQTRPALSPREQFFPFPSLRGSSSELISSQGIELLPGWLTMVTAILFRNIPSPLCPQVYFGLMVLKRQSQEADKNTFPMPCQWALEIKLRYVNWR